MNIDAKRRALAGALKPPVTDAARKAAPVRVERQVAGRGGKGVSVITGLPLPPSETRSMYMPLPDVLP